jgi:hypothetical protein
MQRRRDTTNSECDIPMCSGGRLPKPRFKSALIVSFLKSDFVARCVKTVGETVWNSSTPLF